MSTQVTIGVPSNTTLATADPDVLLEDFTLLQPPDPVSTMRPATARAEDSYALTIALVVTAVLALIGLTWLLIRHRLRLKARGEAAHSVALRELRRLREINDPVGLREAVSSLSGTVRRYTEARFDLHAPTLTTEEFLEAQRMSRKIPDLHDPFWSRFFETSDPIKYAGIRPSREQVNTLLDHSIDFVETSSNSRRRGTAG